MRWHISHRFDPRALPLANRHYNRQTPDAPQFVPPGRCLVLLTADASALWVTSWPVFAQHAWVGAWVNTLFRNERSDLHLSSELIAEAVAATRAHFGTPPLKASSRSLIARLCALAIQAVATAKRAGSAWARRMSADSSCCNNWPMRCPLRAAPSAHNFHSEVPVFHLVSENAALFVALAVVLLLCGLERRAT